MVEVAKLVGGLGAAAEEDEYETIHSFVWRVSGPPAESYEMALQELYDSGWMDDDACAQSPEACKALLAALGESDEDDD